MKKFLSILLVLVLAFSMLSVHAAANYCELFDKTLGCLSFVDDYGNESTPWSANSIAFVTAQNIGFWDYFNESKSDMAEGMECYSVPKDKFEALANKLFDVKVDLTTVNYDSMIDITYDLETLTYDVITHNAGGGAFYHVYGYKQSGNIYNVYMQQSADGELYEDYALAKCTLNGNYVKIISFEIISSLPNINTLVTWPKNEPVTSPIIGTVTKEESSSKPISSTTTASDVSSDIVSDTSSNESSDISDIAEVDVFVNQSDIFVSANKGVLPENTTVHVTKIETADGIEFLNGALKDIAKTYTAYDITAINNSLKVQPNGKVYATFDIPANYDIDKVMVLYVSEDGQTEDVPFTIDKAAEQVTAELSHLSTYAVIEATDDYLGESGGGSVVTIIILVVFVLACAGVYAWYMLYYKKKLNAKK